MKCIKNSVAGKINMLTIAIPTYKRHSLLMETVKSAASQITKFNYQIIICDNDHETSQTFIDEIIKIAPDKISYIINETNIGMFGNWNKCMSVCDTTFFTILSDDDILTPNFVEATLSVLKINSDIKVLAVETEVFGSKKANSFNKVVKIRTMVDLFFAKKRSTRLYLLNLEHYLVGIPHFGSLGIVINSETIRDGLKFDENFYPISDIVFTTKLQQNYGCYFLKLPLAKYRIHESESSNPKTISSTIEKTIQFKKDVILGSEISSKHVAKIYLNLLKLKYKLTLYNFWNQEDTKNIYSLARTALSKLVAASVLICRIWILSRKWLKL